jgi:hypothetical protein
MGKAPNLDISQENKGLQNKSSRAIKFNLRGQVAPKTIGSK